MKQDLKVVGHNAVRLDILEKVTGAAEYTDDIAFGPNLLHMAVLGSPLRSCQNPEHRYQ